MGKSNPFKLMLEGLNCANCANKIEERVNRLELVEEANLNFSTSQLIVKLYDESMKSQAIEEIKSITLEDINQAYKNICEGLTTLCVLEGD